VAAAWLSLRNTGGDCLKSSRLWAPSTESAGSYAVAGESGVGSAYLTLHVLR
jgi:hypothetical protein